MEVPLLCRQADWNWAWTIERPWFERSAESELFSLAAEFDAVLEMRPSGEPCYEFGALDFAADRIRLRCPNGALHDYDPARCDPHFWTGVRSLAVEAEIDGERWVAAPAISPASVSRHLADWVAEQTSRSDIRFRWDAQIEEGEYMQHVRVQIADYLEHRGEEPADPYAAEPGVTAGHGLLIRCRYEPCG